MRPLSDKTFAELWAQRALSLTVRARGGNKWVPAMTAIFDSEEAGQAAGRWIGIESGGNPRAQSSLNERGLAQVSKQSLKELGLTEAEYALMIAASTADHKHADMAAKIMIGESIALVRGGTTQPVEPGWGPGLKSAKLSDGVTITGGPEVRAIGIGACKLRHGLPLLVKELRDQGHLRITIPLTIRSALTGAIGQGTPRPKFAPSARLASFAKGAHALTGDPAQDLLLRFLCSAAVVAHGAAAVEMGLAFTPQKGKVS